MATFPDLIKIGILSSAHLHCASYVSCLKHRSDAEVIGLWDNDAERGQDFCKSRDLKFFDKIDDLLSTVDAVVVTSENNLHLELVEIAAKHGKHVICEKPVVARHQDLERLEKAVSKAGITFMTAFPCRFSQLFPD